MTKPVSFGVISTARIGWEKVIPAMQKSKFCKIDAICSRDLPTAQAMAKKLGIAKAYGSYEAMLDDKDIEAVYNPLPNHLHVPWSIAALKAGKHVLCEKPIGLDAKEASKLVGAEKKYGKIAAEAFMVRHHPQWQRAREIVRSGEIGDVRSVQTFFSYFNDDAGNVRNQADIGGGGVYDIGCYAIVSARYIFGSEPERVVSLIERDPKFGTDRLASALMEFPGQRHLTFSVSTQLVPYQRVQICGTKGRIEVQIPFNAIPDVGMKILIDTGAGLSGEGIRTEVIPACDQYGLQGDAFAKAIRGEATFEFGIADSVAQMKVIDGVFKSAKLNRWVKI